MQPYIISTLLVITYYIYNIVIILSPGIYEVILRRFQNVKTYIMHCNSYSLKILF